MWQRKLVFHVRCMIVPMLRWTAWCLVALVLVVAGPAAADNDREFMAQLVARTFFRSVLEGGGESVLPLCAPRVNLDGEWVKGREALTPRLRQMGQRAREQGLQLRKVVVVSYREAVRRYGPPPARLRGAVGPGKLVALARFNLRGAVAILGRVGAFWKVVAVTD